MKYDDIIMHKNHKSRMHPHMSRYNRAAQFAPFAALTGYGEAINEVGRNVSKRKILSEEEISLLNSNINYIKKMKEPFITVTYFEQDNKKNGGLYQNYSGDVKRVDIYEQYILFLDKKKIFFKDIISIIYENND